MIDHQDKSILQVQGLHTILVRRAGSYQKSTVVGIDPNTGLLREMEVLIPCGKVEELSFDNNLALTQLKTQMSHLVIGHQTVTRFINRMAWGSGGHVPGDPSTPVVPSTSDASLDSTVLVKPITSFEHPSTTSVMIYAFILEGEANGFTISEAGLVCADNHLVARRTFGGLAKSADFVFENRWLLAF